MNGTLRRRLGETLSSTNPGSCYGQDCRPRNPLSGRYRLSVLDCHARVRRESRLSKAERGSHAAWRSPGRRAESVCTALAPTHRAWRSGKTAVINMSQSRRRVAPPGRRSAHQIGPRIPPTKPLSACLPGNGRAFELVSRPIDASPITTPFSALSEVYI